MADEYENSSRDILISQLRNKDQYINELAQAIDKHNDLRIYQLLEPLRYQDEIDNTLELEFGKYPFELVKDQRQELAHFLSDNLIDYLVTKFPFFYYREIEKGQFIVFFGNWWDRREVGTLDALNIEYQFDETKMSQIQESLKLSDSDQSLNSDKINELSMENVELQKLAQGQAEREAKKQQLEQKQAELNKGGLFESSKIKEERQKIIDDLAALEEESQKAMQAPSMIRENQKQILALSKEDTTIALEMEALGKKFESFEDFQSAVSGLYRDYLTTLLDEGQVKSNG